MKKRLLMFMLSLGLFFSMSGCQKMYLSDKEAEDSARENDDINEDTDNDTNDKTDTDKSDSDYKMAVVPVDVIVDWDSVYLVYSDKSIKKVISEKGNWYRSAKLVDNLIFIEMAYSDVGGGLLTVADTDGNKVASLFYDFKFNNLNVGKYKDDIYVTYSYYDYMDEKTHYYSYKYNPDSKKLEEDLMLADVMRYIADNSYDYLSAFGSLITTLDKCGEAILSSDGKIFVLNLDDYSIRNERTYCDGSESGNADALFGDSVLYHSTDDYFTPSDYYLLDMKTGKKEHIMKTDSDEMMEILSMDDDCIYYYTYRENDESTAYVYSYNVKEKKDSLLYTAVTPPGTDEFELRCGVSGAAYIEGRLYVQDITDMKVVWAYYDADTEKYEYSDMIIHEYSYGKYGTVSVAEGNQFYDDTNKISYRYKLEDFTLNDSVPSYNIINHHLKKENDKYFEYAMDGMDSMKDEVYDEDGYYYHMSLDRTLGGVQMIGSHYMQIIFNLYDYTGGAHGYGWADYLMYDLDSGKQISLSMLTNLDADSYKKLVAEKIMAGWKKDEYSFYEEYEDTPQEERDNMYQNFYDDADMDRDIIGFYEDGIILYYSPYGSYFIEVPISYEELGIDINS